MIIPCDLVLKDCLPCNDDPIVNITAEAPDQNVFIGFHDFRGNPPLGVTFAQIGCFNICFSTVSQREADLCAQRNAQACTWNTWRPPVVPPIPPGPDGNTHNFNTPGGIPPGHPRNPIRQFLNHRQTCDVTCPDGTVFTEVVEAGEVRALNQDEADKKAQSLACKFALEDRICIVTDELPGACVNQVYVAQLAAEGGFPFANQQYEWEIAGGNLPPGLDLDFVSGLISGTTFINGNFDFTVIVTDSLGTIQVKDFSICVMEIITSATLPKATESVAYATPLIQEPGVVSSEVWTLVSGSLPDGLHLASNGSISGTPTEIDTFDFQLRVVATCGGQSVSCTKSFSLEVVSSVDCMGAPNEIDLATWHDVSLAGCSFTMVAGDGSFIGTPSPATQCQVVGDPFCNPKHDPYNLTVQWDWTGSGYTVATANATRVIFRLDGIDVNFSPFFNANGTFSHTQVVSLPSGVHTIAIRIVCTAGGPVPPSKIVGTCTIRPLTPP